MHAAILHETIGPDARADERDALVQVEAIATALHDLACTITVHSVGLNLDRLRGWLRRERPHVVVNLVEALGGHGRLIHLVPALLEAVGVAFTGVGSLAMALTTDKLATKRALRRAGLPTPDWCAPDDGVAFAALPDACIIKPVWEDASLGIDDDAVVQIEQPRQLRAELRRRLQYTHTECFAERFVPGREFNLSLLADNGECRVLSPAEIVFQRFPAGKPRIVGYAAKWTEGSFEYEHTPRRFGFSEPDAPLLLELSTLARACWRLFRLRGYARVDFRVDRHGRPWILEVNANPCLAPDAGFLAAARHDGLSSADVIERLLADATAAARKGSTEHVPNSTHL